MSKLFGNNICHIFYTAGLICLAASTAQSRMWSKFPVSLAQDYSLITDNRDNGEFVTLLWVSPPLLPDGPSTQPAKDLLNKYVVLGVVHAHQSKDGTMTFERVATLEVSDGNKQPLNSLDTNSMPPVVVGTLAIVQTMFSRNLGAFGQGMQWFVFQGGAVNACGKGGMFVHFAGETYSYKTPIPGCRSAT